MTRRILYNDIRFAEIRNGGHGPLHVWIQFGSGPDWMSPVLSLPPDFANYHHLTPTGHCIHRILEVAGAERWGDLPERRVRIDADAGRVYRIGHYLREDWFDPAAELQFPRADGDDL